MRFGTALPGTQNMPDRPEWERGDVGALVAVARKADELGYAWLPCSDHVVIPQRYASSMGTMWYEPATTLAFVAGVTQRTRLLTHVLVLPYHNALQVAKQYSTLDRLSGGRVILGVGAGHLRGEFRALGAPYEERGAATDEAVRAIRVLWSDDPATFHGERYDFWDVHLSPRPVQPHIPIWVGGNSRRAARRAVELGDGWIPFELTFDELRERIVYLRSLPRYERATPFDIVVPAGAVDLMDDAVDGARAPFNGSRQQIIDDIAAYIALGATGMTATFRARSLDEHLEKLESFAREIMPAFR
ncbi:MAG: LLM class F420-dependent oxidoreductase [Dehalococcoidia bacterium]